MPPARPTNLTAIPGDGQVTLTFTGSPGATSYRLYWGAQTSVSKTTGTALGTVTSPALHQGLTNGTTYFYVVTAVNNAGESADSVVASAIPSQTAAALNPQVLSRRPDLDAAAVRVGSRVDARFDRDLAGATATSANVSLQLLDGGVVASSIAAAGPLVTITPTTPLAFETTYRVTLGTGLRDNANRPLARADTWTFTTGSPPPVATAHVGDSAATITWTEVPGTIYSVVTRSRPGVQNTTQQFTVHGNTFTDSLSNGLLYAYEVAVWTPFGLSAPSQQVTVTPQPSRPQPPTGVSVVTGRTTALLSWNAATSATGYSVYRANRAAGTYTRIATNFQSTTFLDTGLTPDAIVSYVVQTESLNGTSAWSRQAVDQTEGTLLPRPATFTATPGNTWVRLVWSPVPGASAYVVWRALWPNGDVAHYALISEGTTFDDLSANVGSTYRYFVGAISQSVISDLAEASASPVPGLPLPAPVLLAPAIEVNRVIISAAGSSVSGVTLEALRSTSLDGGYAPVSTFDTTAVGGTRYFYTARYTLGAASSDLSPPIEITPAAAVTPAMPQNVAVSVASGGADVTFDVVPNATSYQVGSATAPGGTPTVRCTSFDGLDNRCVTSLIDNQTVYLSVRALNGSTTGPWSSELQVRPTNLGDSAGLTTPTITVNEGSNFVTFSWALVPGATHYRVFRRTRTTPWALMTTTSLLWFQDATARNGTEYRYAVQATNQTAPNNRFSVPALSGFVRPSALAPPRPQIVSIVPTNGGALVRWSPIPGVRSYSVRAAFNAGGAPSNNQSSCSSFDAWNPVCELNLANGTQYFVAVSAFGQTANGSSAWSDEGTVTPNPAGPPRPTGVAVGPANERLVISATPEPQTTYRLTRRKDGRAEVDLGPIAAPWIIESQPNGIEFVYGLQAETSSGLSFPALSNATAASALAPPPPTLLEVVGGAARLTAWWSPVAGSSQYRLRTADAATGPWTSSTNTFEPFRSTVTVNGVTNGQPVYVTVEASSASGTSAPSEPMAATPNAAALVTPIPTYINGNQAVQLWWPAVPGAVGYQVLRRSRSSPWATLTSLTSLRYTDFNVENGETWVYQVRAMGPTEPGTWSGESGDQVVLATVPQQPAPPSVRPANGGFFVEWSPVALATGYIVYFASQVDGLFTSTLCSTTGQFETRCRGSGSTPVFVVVRASSAAGPSVTSTPVLSGAPNAGLPTQTSVTVTAPGGAGTLRVAWSAVGGTPTFHVYRRLPNGVPTEVNTTTSLAFVDTGLTSGQQYIYYVEAENGVGRGAWSTPDSATAP